MNQDYLYSTSMKKSIPKHYDEMELYLKSLEFKFSFIGLTETWLDIDKEEFYDLNGYTSVNRYRKDRKGGGVSLPILQGIAFALGMTWIILKARWKLCLLQLIKVSSLRVQTLSLGLYIACLIPQLLFSMIVYLTY